MSRALHIVQHVPFEGPGFIRKWAVMRGRRPVIIRRYRDDPLPDVATLQAVVVMGGPMGVFDEASYPWLAEEKAWLAQLVEKEVPVVGVCLGAQLLAHVLGAEVWRGPEPEIGWFPVRKRTSGRWPMADLPSVMTVFHWHGDSFDLPAGAIHLAESEAYPHQAFLWRRHVLGLQFHLEMDADVLHALLRHSPLPEEGPYVQSAAAMRRGLAQYAAANHQWLTALLDAFFGG